METLIVYCTGFGLAAGAGGRASLAVLCLALFSYTDYFEIAPRFDWIVSIPVMVVLAVVAVVEMWADAHPELGELSEFANYLPKMIAGFIAFAAATGDVDSNILQLGTSGIIGATTATGYHFLRSKVRNAVREVGENTHSSVDTIGSFADSGLSLGLAGSAILMPIVVPVLLIVMFAAGFWLKSWLDNRRKKCVHCGESIRMRATVCGHCDLDQEGSQLSTEATDNGSDSSQISIAEEQSSADTSVDQAVPKKGEP